MTQITLFGTDPRTEMQRARDELTERVEKLQLYIDDSRNEIVRLEEEMDQHEKEKVVVEAELAAMPSPDR